MLLGENYTNFEDNMKTNRIFRLLYIDLEGTT